MKQKLYCYVDESGQDTKGLFFVVSIVILEKNRDLILRELEEIETASGKKNVKWHRSKPQFRQDYINSLLQSMFFKNKIYFETFTNTKQYIKMTSYATARAIAKNMRGENYNVSVYIDGFRKQEIRKFSKILSEFNIRRRKVMGVKRDENNSLIRLADAICGLVRDAQDKNEWAKKAVEKLIRKKVINIL